MAKSIAWDSKPDPVLTRQTFEMIRCPATSTGPWLVTCHEVIGVQVFWMQGRSQPHLGEECPGCRENKPHRWCGWLAVYDENRMRHCILEISPLCLGTINEFGTQMGTLRGARILLRRPSGKKNGRIVAELQPSKLGQTQIPEPFDLKNELIRLWDAPGKHRGPKLETPRSEVGKGEDGPPQQPVPYRHPADQPVIKSGKEAEYDEQARQAIKRQHAEARKRRQERLKQQHTEAAAFNEAAAAAIREES